MSSEKRGQEILKMQNILIEQLFHYIKTNYDEQECGARGNQCGFFSLTSLVLGFSRGTDFKVMFAEKQKLCNHVKFLLETSIEYRERAGQDLKTWRKYSNKYCLAVGGSDAEIDDPVWNAAADLWQVVIVVCSFTAPNAMSKSLQERNLRTFTPLGNKPPRDVLFVNNVSNGAHNKAFIPKHQQFYLQLMDIFNA